MRPDKPAKLEEVAELAGVSKMTVSLALRGGESTRRMSTETRERVLLAAKELGYSPNARARALRLGRTNVIGLYAGHGFINVRRPFFTEIVSGLQEGCEQIRKDLLLHGVFHGASSDDIYRELVDGRIDGLIVTMAPTDFLAERLADSKFSVVAVADPVPGIPAVVVDDAEGSRLIAEHLYAKGHRRVVYGMSPARPMSAARRRDAFLRGAEALGVRVTVECFDGGATEADTVRGLLEDGATAIACWNDDLAYRLLGICRELGVSVPERLAITGFDGCPSPFTEVFPLTTVAAPWAEVAKRAVLSLDALLKGQALPPETTLPVRLLEGFTS